ncbi:OsmC family protein [Natrinema limicola JCM 13563]|uniref:OsmC family protein n=2 Tax=Natrinema limicola TaxID=370323 RepID=M0CNU6_9EURY|nr:OsmC family protein [Natrinema limicola JCM 13563]
MTLKNGIDMEKFEQLTAAAEDDPENAAFRFFAETEWTGDTTCETTVSEIEKGDTLVDSPEFTMEGALFGHRDAPNALEQLLSSLGTCLTITYAAHGAKRDIEISEIRLEFEGCADMRGLLGLADDVRPGFDHIECTAHIESPASTAELEEIQEAAHASSPILDNLENEVTVDIHHATAE